MRGKDREVTPEPAGCLIIWFLGTFANFSIFVASMQPDYPHKIFSDKRMGYCLLMEALAMGSDL